MASTLLLYAALANRVDDGEKRLFSDQASHIMAAQSLWHDQDLKYTLADLARFRKAFPAAGGPRGMFLKQADDGELYYAKPFLYATVTAPFYGVLGSSGFVVLNFLVLLLIAALTVRSVDVHFSRAHSHVLTMALVFLSPFIVWVSIPHPDLLIAALLMSGGYLLLVGSTCISLIVAGILLGLSVYEKPTFVILVPFLVLAARQLTYTVRGLIVVLAASVWFLPTLVQLSQDGNLLAYQGLRFNVADSPYPLEQGWSAPRHSGVDQVFDAVALVKGVLTNLYLMPQKLLDFLIGRQTGIVLYFPVALFLLVTVLFVKPRSAWPVLLAFSAYLVMNWLAFPTNGFGGAGSYGSRYLMQVLPLVALAFVPGCECRARTIGAARSWLKVPLYLSVGLAVALQYKVLPPDETLVRSPANYLAEPPATWFPLERSLLPSIPIHKSGFRKVNGDGRFVIYNLSAIRTNHLISQKAPTNMELVLYQYGERLSHQDLALESTAPSIVRVLHDGWKFWEGVISPGDRTIVSVPADVFGREYHDRLSGAVRWAPIKVEVAPYVGDAEYIYVLDVGFPKPTPGSSLDYGTEIDAEELNQNGIRMRFDWSVLEDWGVWTNGHYADLTFSLGKEETDSFKIELDVGAYIVEEHPWQEVDIYVDGLLQDHWRFDLEHNWGPRTVEVDGVGSRGGSVTVGFRLRNPNSPSGLGRGDDPRMLGIGLRSVRVEPVRTSRGQ